MIPTMRQSYKSGRTLEGYDEGIYGRVERWVLYSSDSPKLALAPFLTATARLDAVPTVPALDPLVS